jgi:hypothetical protein
MKRYSLSGALKKVLPPFATGAAITGTVAVHRPLIGSQRESQK